MYDNVKFDKGLFH